MFFVMKYSNRPDELNLEQYNGAYATFDLSSDRPYPVSTFPYAQIWTDPVKAKETQKKFPFLDVYELSIGLEPADL